MLDLKKKFIDLLGRYESSSAVAQKYWSEIESAYSHKNRYYHNLNHISHMCNELETASSSVIHLDNLVFAIFYHDIIYKASRSDNELQSARLFEKRIAVTTFQNIEVVKEQIIHTKTHQQSNDPDTNILLDIDLAILGQSPDMYQTYCANIRREYHIYPDFMYNKGRKKVLAHFLKAETIFKTEHFRALYETQARKNIEHELRSLS